jgi:hypothetical protein
MANEPTTSFSARALMRDAADEIDRLNKLVADLTNSLKETREALVNRDETCDRLIREHTEAIAACAGLTYQRDQYHAAVGFLLDGLDSNLDEGGLTSAEWDVIIAKSRKLADEGSEPNPGQPLLDELDRLRRLEAAVEDDSLMRLFYKDSGSADVTGLVLCSYRDALLAGEPEAEKPHGPTCMELTTAFRGIQRLLTEYLVPDGCNAHETITKILAITDTKPFSQLRRETHDETRI